VGGGGRKWKKGKGKGAKGEGGSEGVSNPSRAKILATALKVFVKEF